MPASKRYKTKHPGVFYIIGKRLGGSGEEKIYYIIFKKNGRTYEEKAGRQFSDGMNERQAADFLSARIKGEPSKREAREKLKQEKSSGCHTVKDMWAYFLAHRSAGKASVAGLKVDTCYYERYLKPLEKVRIEELTTADICALRDKVFTLGKSPQTVKHILSLLRRMIRFCAKNGQCSLPDPSKLHFEMPRVDNQKTEHLTSEQLSRLIKALDEEPDQDAAAFVRLALATGMRKGALIGLRWDDIDFDRGFITLCGETAKNNKTEQIPMNSTVREILQQINRTNSAYVFPGRDGRKRSDFRRLAKRVRDKADLPESFRPLHGLRHSFASFLASSGQVNLYTLQRLLTHSSPQMTQRYAHLADEAMQRAASVAEGIFGETTDK
ncbi:integrase [Deltaproteobacteria bacterium Smac51]|nr:integrase [Deltaproteobacteria bacterium Smac51]